VPSQTNQSMLSANPTSLSFGNVQVGDSSAQSGTLRNTGFSRATISGVTVAGLGYSVSGVVEGQMITPGQSALITITFAPTRTGSAVGSLSIASDASNSPTVISLLGGSHLVDLSWNPSATLALAGYNVYRGAEENGAYPLTLYFSLAQGTTFEDTAVTAGQKYSYVVKAVGSDGTESAPSNPAFATIPFP
jgi:Abnormal spindle-like microcephaly-assoc'd, ASPM-SPD-2-Hydin